MALVKFAQSRCGSTCHKAWASLYWNQHSWKLEVPFSSCHMESCCTLKSICPKCLWNEVCGRYARWRWRECWQLMRNLLESGCLLLKTVHKLHGCCLIPPLTSSRQVKLMIIIPSLIEWRCSQLIIIITTTTTTFVTMVNVFVIIIIQIIIIIIKIIISNQRETLQPLRPDRNVS